MNASIRNPLLALALALASACSGSSGSSRSGVEPEKPLSSLDDHEAETLCSWNLERLGGAGQTIDCGDYTYANLTLERCESSLPQDSSVDCLQWTVGDVEACVRALAPTKLCSIETLPAECPRRLL